MTSPPTPKKARPRRAAPPKAVPADVAAKRAERAEAEALDSWTERLDGALVTESRGFSRDLIAAALGWEPRFQRAAHDEREAHERSGGTMPRRYVRGPWEDPDELERMVASVALDLGHALAVARDARSSRHEANKARRMIETLYAAANGEHDRESALLGHIAAWAEHRAALGFNGRAADDHRFAAQLAMHVHNGFGVLVSLLDTRNPHNPAWETFGPRVGEIMDSVKGGKASRDRRPNGTIEAAVALNELAGRPLGALTVNGLKSAESRRRKK